MIKVNNFYAAKDTRQIGRAAPMACHCGFLLAQQHSQDGSMIGRQLLRYVAAGGSALMVDVAVFAWLRFGTGLDLIASNLLGRAAGAGAAFLINRNWTFRKPNYAQSSWGREASRYGVLWLTASTVSSLGISFAAGALGARPGIGENLIKLCVEAMIASLSFVISKQWVFRSVAMTRQGPTPIDPRRGNGPR